MSPPASDPVIADPIGVLCAAIEAVEDALSPEQVRKVVETVAGGRAKQRKLAKAVAARPTMLQDGRSPAPRSVGDLLIALQRGGAQRISVPRCARCTKALRTLQRRGVDWYCAPCVSEPVECASCGNYRQLFARDREGRPRCSSCPPDDGDPTESICAVLASVDPTIPKEVVQAAVSVVTSRAGQRRQLAWALEDQPGLLTGAGAASPVPSVLRLIDALLEAGATTIVRPPCPHCGRVMTLSKMREGLRCCRNCEAKAKAVPCGRCGAVSQPATRDEKSRPLCSHCLSTDPANQELCISCGRRRPVSVRSPDGPLCPNCRPMKEQTCAICGNFRPCDISKTTGEPWCQPCGKRWIRCSSCEEVRPLRGGTTDKPLCASCTRPDPTFLKRCPRCGNRAQLRAGPCARCGFEAQVRELLSGDDGAILPELQVLFQSLLDSERPDTVKGFISKDKSAAVLRELARGERRLTHAALDELGGSKPVEHLQSVLVVTGALPSRDEQMARLERFIATTIAARQDHDEQHLLRRYGIWHLLRRLRHRGKAAETTYSQTAVVKSHLRAAIALLDWLAGRGLTLATARQGDLEEWLASDEITHRRAVGHFVRWAARERLTALELPAERWGGPSGPIDAEAHFAKARSLLDDTTVDVGDRVAGLLVLLYAQRAAAISRLSVAHVERRDDGAVRLRLGTVPIVLPSPLDALVLDLVASRHGHALLGDQGTSPWLFPGGQPGRPISASRLVERLDVLGVPSGATRSTALFGLAAELPAALLSRLLGIHISVAVQWQHASSGDWTRYAAEVGRRIES